MEVLVQEIRETIKKYLRDCQQGYWVIRDTFLFNALPARILSYTRERKKKPRDSYQRIRNYGTRGIGNLFGNYFYTYVYVWGVFLYYDFGNFGVEFVLVFFTINFFKHLAITIFRFKRLYIFLVKALDCETFSYLSWIHWMS